LSRPFDLLVAIPSRCRCAEEYRQVTRQVSWNHRVVLSPRMSAAADIVLRSE